MSKGKVKTYNVISPFLLSFIIDDEQRDILFNKNGDGYVESDGVTVWYVTYGTVDDEKEKRYESITTPNVIEVGLMNGALLEIPHFDFHMETKMVPAETYTLTIEGTFLKTEEDEDHNTPR